MPIRPKEPTKLEQEYIELKKQYVAAMNRVHAKYADKLSTLKAKLAVSGKCTHPHVVDFNWESDNGYGRQSWRKGLECSICGLKNDWPESSELWYNPLNSKRDN